MQSALGVNTGGTNTSRAGMSTSGAAMAEERRKVKKREIMSFMSIISRDIMLQMGDSTLLRSTECLIYNL